MAFGLATASTFCIIISALFVAFGWRQILRKKRKAHRKLMLLGASFALLFFVTYAAKTVFIGNTSFGGPTAWKVPYVIFLLFHIVLSTSAAIFGVITLFLAFSQRFAAHRKWGRVTAAFWLATAVTGVVVYLLLYIVFPGGHTGSLPNAVINR